MKTNQIFFLVGFQLFFFATASAQLLPPFPHTAQTWINPAAFPVEYQLDEDKIDWYFNAAVRQQWRELEGPEHLALRADWMQKDNANVNHVTWAGGINLLAFNTDPVRQVGGMVRVAIRKPLSKGWRMAGGFSLGFQQYSIDLAKMIVLHPDDPVLASALQNSGRAALGGGLFLYKIIKSTEKGNQSIQPGNQSIWAGISMPQLSWPLKKGTSQAVSGEFYNGPVFLIIGYHIPFVDVDNKKRIFIEPTLQYKYEKEHPQVIEGSFKIGFQNDSSPSQIWFRTGLSSTKMWLAEIGGQKKIGNWYARISIAYCGFSRNYKQVAPNAYEAHMGFHREL